MKAGYDPNYGIDKYFISKAEGRKKIAELESIDYQIDLLSGLNDEVTGAVPALYIERPKDARPGD